MNRIAIYTAIYGGYDELNVQPHIRGVDYHVFTDNGDLRSDQWTVHHAPGRFEHPRMSAKYFKALPHRVLPQYDVTIYIDGGIRIERPLKFKRMALRALDGHGIALFKHPDRDNVEDEVAVSALMTKYEGLPVAEQVRHYERKGFRDDVGLYAMGILTRDSRIRKVRRFGRLWLRENARWTYQDQLSAPYLFWKLGLKPGLYPEHLWDTDLISFRAHASDS